MDIYIGGYMWSNESIQLAQDVALGWKDKAELCWSLWADDKYDLSLLDLDSRADYPNIIKTTGSEFNEMVLEAVNEYYSDYADNLIEAAQMEMEDDRKFDDSYNEHLWEDNDKGIAL